MGVQLSGQDMQSSQQEFSFGFFKLENNHDKAIVRLLHENYEDFSIRPVHFVKLPGSKWRRGVNCLRSDRDPESVCPLCSCNLSTEDVSKRRKRIYIEFLVYKILDRNNKVIQDFMSSPKRMVWERDKSFDDKIFSLASRYRNLDSVVFQVERFGEAGSTQTQYDIYQIDVDQSQYPYELPEKTYNPDGVQLLDKTAEEMNYYIENGDFPPTDNGEGKVQRRADAQQTPQNQGVQSQTVPQQNNLQPNTTYAEFVQPTQPINQPVQPTQVYAQQAVAQENTQPQPQQTVSRRRSI